MEPQRSQRHTARPRASPIGRNQNRARKTTFRRIVVQRKSQFITGDGLAPALCTLCLGGEDSCKTNPIWPGPRQGRGLGGRNVQNEPNFRRAGRYMAKPSASYEDCACRCHPASRGPIVRNKANLPAEAPFPTIPVFQHSTLPAFHPFLRHGHRRRTVLLMAAWTDFGASLRQDKGESHARSRCNERTKAVL